MMNAMIEKQLLQAAEPYLQSGRKGDREHTLRAVDYGKYLLASEPGDPGIVLPCLYLHDIGWSRVDYQDFIKATPAKKKGMCQPAAAYAGRCEAGRRYFGAAGLRF